MTTTQAVRVLPADVFDGLEFSAERYGGIGQPAVFDAKDCPVCIYGHAGAIGGPMEEWPTVKEILDTLNGVGIFGYNSDAAVERINVRLGRRLTARVPFHLWCAELGVVRGE